MALSNASGAIVLTTGNKSEMAVGYATLYGDMAGGFAVLKDVFKTLLYEWRAGATTQAGRDLIPENTLDKPPSAELRPDQKDTDSLPPYEVLDPILRAYVEEDRAPAEISRMGYDAATVRRVMTMVERANTSGARRRPASRSPSARLAATAACPSPMATKTAAPRRRRPSRAWEAASPAQMSSLPL